MIANLDGRNFLRGILAGLTFVALLPMFVAPGCGTLTASQGAALDALDVGACSALVAVSVAIPVPGAQALVAGACAGEEAAVAAAIAHAEVVVGPTKPTLPDAGTATIAVYPDGGVAAVGEPLFRGVGRARKRIAACPIGFDATKVKVAQAHIDAQTDGGK